MDWSYAGYAAGEAPLPNLPVACSVKDFGAVGNGVTDDSNAFLRAIAATKSGAIYIPPGRYALSKQLIITQPGVVLRGAGNGATTLYFTKSLTDLYGQTWQGGNASMNGGDASGTQSDWKNAPGLIRFLGPSQSSWMQLATVTANAQRTAKTLTVSDTSQLQPGMWVTLTQSDNGAGASLRALVNARPSCLSSSKCMSAGPGPVLRWHSRVAAVRPGGVLVLERRLPFNVSTSNSPTLYRFTRGINNVGIENLQLEMKWQRYRGHFLEDGWNGIEFTDASQCWARDITILNSDTMLSVYRSSFCTLTGITMGVTAPRGPGGINCHHGLNISSSQDILVTNFSMTTKCYHDVVAFNFTVGVVFANGTGVDLCMDHHRFYPLSVLWSNIVLGAATRPFQSGGLTPWGDLTAGYTTFWNVQASRNKAIMQGPPGYDAGPHLNLIGLRFLPSVTISAAIATQQDWLIEKVPSSSVLFPTDLYSSMLRKRLAQPVVIPRAMPA